MSRYRLSPTPGQGVGLEEHCGHARYVWNLAVEQQSWWTRYRGKPPNHLERCRQLTDARAEFDWLKAGSQTIQQQALRDFDQAMRNFFGGSHRRPTFRKRGQSEGFQVVGKNARVEKLNRRWSRCWVPKTGWVKFRVSRKVPDFKSYRVTRDRAGRWHVAFAAVPVPVDPPGTGEVVGVDRGVAVSAALSTGELRTCPGLLPTETERLHRWQRRLARA
ncbi:RNA-guided endonuclease TnpB family protein, partial [Frankia sp. Ag45/Mut15]